MVYDDSVLKTIETEHRRNGAAFPMSGIPLYKLEFTTYVDDSEQEVDSEIMLRFARLLHSAVLRTNYELNTQSGVEREGVEASLPIKAKIVIFDWRCRIVSIGRDVGCSMLANEPTRSYIGPTRG